MSGSASSDKSIPMTMHTVSLNGIWSVRPEALDCAGETGLERVRGAPDGWIEARVPGEIHLDLIRAGQMPEPAVGANMPKCRWPETRSWWYRTYFELDDGFLMHELQELVFEGLDLYAQVFLNGKPAGESQNAFVPARFDVRRLLQAGRNELVVRMTSGNELAMKAEWSLALGGGDVRGDIGFPQEWRLFGPVEKNDPEPAIDSISEVPEELEVGPRRFQGRRVFLNGNRLDLGPFLGGAECGKTAYLFAEVMADKDTEATIGSGMDWCMKWWINGRLVCDTTITGNASAEIRLDDRCFNVRLKKGRNVLAVKAISGRGGFIWVAGGPQELRKEQAADKIPNPLREEDIYRHRGWMGRRWLRKPQFSYGWDWVDALPNIGIWRGVRLEGRTCAVLQDLRLDTVRRGSEIILELDAVVENLHPWSERACVLVLEIKPPDRGSQVCRQYTLNLPPGRVPVRDIIEIPDAKLWWPNGMGDQPLYRVTARMTDAAGTICDVREFSIGLRTVEIDRSRLPEGSRFCFRINGQEVFCRGGNIVPHDVILARVSEAKSEALVAEAKNANMNMVRAWGGAAFESPAFYNACDRAGIMIWQDFMFACCTKYPDDSPAFREAVRKEADAAIRLLRHHPSLVLWCGNNECTEGFCSLEKNNSDARAGGKIIYNQILPDLCRHLDPRRQYWPGSPCGGDTPQSELQGDCHWWSPFSMNEDINRRIRHETFDECRSRFVSEYGVIGPCHLDSMKEYLSPEDLHPESLAWKMHTNPFMKEGTLEAAIRLHYADPERLTLSEYVLYGQLFQAVIHGNAMEALRFRKHDPGDDCQGALIWSFSDCWGETGWSIVDYYLRRKASYYWLRRACRPVKAIIRRRGGSLVTRIVNDTLRIVHGTVESGWWRLDGTDRNVESRSITLPADRMLEICVAAIPPSAQRDPRQWLYAAVLRDDNGIVTDQALCLLKPYRELDLPGPELRVTSPTEDVMEVSSPAFAHAVHAEDHGRELLSDNWFDLLPGVPLRISIERKHPDRIKLLTL